MFSRDQSNEVHPSREFAQLLNSRMKYLFPESTSPCLLSLNGLGWDQVDLHQNHPVRLCLTHTQSPGFGKPMACCFRKHNSPIPKKRTYTHNGHRGSSSVNSLSRETYEQTKTMDPSPKQQPKSSETTAVAAPLLHKIRARIFPHITRSKSRR
jgi:hypothetical protein